MPKNKLILVVISLLILATLMAFSHVGNHGFVNFDDNVYITAKPHIQDGITVPGIMLGLHDRSRRKLASADLDIPHAGYPDSSVLILTGIIW